MSRNEKKMSKHPIINSRRPLANTGIFRIEEMDLEFSNGQTRCYQRIVGSSEGAVLIVPMPDPQTVLLSVSIQRAWIDTTWHFQRAA